MPKQLWSGFESITRNVTDPAECVSGSSGVAGTSRRAIEAVIAGNAYSVGTNPMSVVCRHQIVVRPRSKHVAFSPKSRNCVFLYVFFAFAKK